MSRVDEYKRMIAQGWSIEFIAKDFNVTVEAVTRALLRDRHKLEMKEKSK